MHLILSPHPDDAVLSLGACISAWVRAGEKVSVMTIFDGGGDGPLTPAAIEDRSRYKEDPVQLRKSEDVRASEYFGFDLLSVSMPELVYRFRRDGSARCQSLADIYGPLIEDDSDVVDSVAAVIAQHGGSSVVHVPMATGGHSDHRIVRAAAERVLDMVHYYDDLPYAIRLKTNGPSVEWPAIDDIDREKWINGINIYASQLANLFEDDGDWPDDFLRWSSAVS